MDPLAKRYSRHEDIPGWNQKIISEKKVVVIGSDKIADFIVADLAAIGCGSIKRLGVNNNLPYEDLNNDVIVEQKPGSIDSFQHAQYFCDEADLIIEATNNLASKQLVAKAVETNRALYISACAGRESFSLLCNEYDQSMQSSHKELNTPSGLLNGIVGAACVLDEVRKYWMPRSNESPRKSVSFNGIQEKDNLEMKVLQIGAGAIGTTTAIALAMMGANLTIVDFDKVEESNLTRQFMFYDQIGFNKAEALASKLSKYAVVNARTDKIERGCDLRGYDIVLSCVDNHKARYALHESALKQNIPLINGGSSIFAGSTMTFMPKKTACLDCQSNYSLSNSLVETKPAKPKVPGRCFEPSLLLANQIVGGLMINSILKIFQGKYQKAHYQSGYDLFLAEIPSSCYDSCTAERIS